MEVKIGDYGRMMFEMMAGADRDLPGHWKSIREKAEPLVRQLIALNDEMKPSGYTIVGYRDEHGKKRLSKFERIRKAQRKLLGVKTEQLKVGDRVWLQGGDHDMEVGFSSPATVDSIKNGVPRVEMDHYGDEVLYKISPYEKVLKAPDDYNEETEELFSNHDYWLQKADELGF